jgi:hypothetical protein
MAKTNLKGDWITASEKEIKRIEKHISEKDSDWLDRWNKRWRAEGNFWEKKENYKDDWL